MQGYLALRQVRHQDRRQAAQGSAYGTRAARQVVGQLTVGASSRYPMVKRPIQSLEGARRLPTCSVRTT